LQQAETLKQSILKMAFEGRLVTNQKGMELSEMMIGKDKGYF
jgi:hypothetical protein